VRTRTLLLLAVACGVAILAAGVAQFVRLTGQDEPARPAAIGAPVEMGDLTVVVGDVLEDAGAVAVEVELSGVADPDAAAGFRLVVPGAALAPSASTAPAPGTAPAAGLAPACTGSTVSGQRCTLWFELPADPGTARVLVLRRGDEQVRWELSGS
jgi:hypothetical protein